MLTSGLGGWGRGLGGWGVRRKWKQEDVMGGEDRPPPREVPRAWCQLQTVGLALSTGVTQAPIRVTECAFWWRRGSRHRFCEYLASEGQQLPVTESSEWPHDWWLNGMECLQGRGWQGTPAGLGCGVFVWEQTAQADGRFGVWRWVACQAPKSSGDEDRTGTMVQGCGQRHTGCDRGPVIHVFLEPQNTTLEIGSL